MFDHSKECTVPLAECRSSCTALAIGSSWSPFQFPLHVSDKIFCSMPVSSTPFKACTARNSSQRRTTFFIVGGSISMISFSRQCIQFAHGMSGAVMKQEVESSQMQGPTSLAMVKFLGHHEILKVLVVGPDFYRMDRFFQKVSPLF